MEHDMKDYFGVGHGYNQKEKQDFEGSMAGAADFLTNGLSNFKKQNNIDTSGESAQYRKQAKEAFSANRMKEAEMYFDKLIQISEKDYEAKFYKHICNILNTGSTTEKIKEAYTAYLMAVNNMPISEDWNVLEFEYAKQMADLILAWFKQFKNQMHDKNMGDWYAYNINIYYEYADLCKVAVFYMDAVMPIILKSDLSDYSKEWDYGWWYCRMCAGHCDGTLYYKVNNRDLAITSNRYCGSLGYPLSVKAPIVERYDAMCFEIRKFSKDFEVCGVKDEYGLENNEYGFDRLNPPTNYDNQQTRNRQTRLAQMAKDREIAQKIAQWKSSGGREKDARERKFVRFLSSHVNERTEYQTIKREVIISEQNLYSSRKACENFNLEVEKIKQLVSEKQSAIAKKQNRIGKLEKRLLGKAKAQGEIAGLQGQISTLSSEIVALEQKINAYVEKMNSEKQAGETLENAVKQSKRKLELFVSNCLI